MVVGKHIALANELEKDILTGKYGWEGGLPSTGELAQNHNMSINTVKSALALLEGKDLIEKRGIGYYINRRDIVMTQYVPPAHIRLPRGGYCKNIGSVRRVPLPNHFAEKLHISGRDVVYRVQISGELVDGNEKPLQISYRYYLIPISDETLKQMENNSTYDPMWDDESIPADLISQDTVSPRMATEGEKDMLNLPDNTPVDSIFESIRDKGDTILMAQEIVMSPRATLIFNYSFTNRP